MSTPTPSPIKGTIVFDSASELARLVFSWDLKKHASQFESIRAVNNYPGTSERMNMIVRRLRDFKRMGWEILIIAHEDIDKIYTRGSMMAKAGKGENNEPTAVKGRIDTPGQKGPEEIMRVADNIFRVRVMNGTPIWVTKPEPIGPGAPEPWQVKDRFEASKIGDFLTPSYTFIRDRAVALKLENWNPPYIWIIYGAVGLKKTVASATWPRPIHHFDFDVGTDVITSEIKKGGIHIYQYNCEEMDDYPKFMVQLETVAGDPTGVEQVKKQLGVK